jgi:hypothetical protein
MARIQYGGGVVDMRGSVGGTTYSRNHAGAYSRARVKPVDPQTEEQMLIRGTLSSLAQHWRDLSPEDRADWALFAEAVSSSPSYAGQARLTGQQAYMRHSLIRVLYSPTPSNALLDPAPPLVNMPAFIQVGGLLEVAQSGGPGSEVFSVQTVLYLGSQVIDPAEELSRCRLQIQSSGVVSAGVVATSSVRRWLTVWDEPSDVPPSSTDISVAYVNVFGPTVTATAFGPTAGLASIAVWLRARFVHLPYGYATEWVPVRVPITVEQ